MKKSSFLKRGSSRVAIQINFLTSSFNLRSKQWRSWVLYSMLASWILPCRVSWLTLCGVFGLYPISFGLARLPKVSGYSLKLSLMSLYMEGMMSETVGYLSPSSNWETPAAFRKTVAPSSRWSQSLKLMAFLPHALPAP